MKDRLPLVLSATALLVALLGSTPLGQAARSTIAQVVPRAKSADYAVNAGKLNGHRSATKPKAGQIPVLGANGKLPASIGAVGPAGPAGAAGAQGPPGATGYQQVARQFAVTGTNAEVSIDCPSGKSVLAGGYQIRPEDGNSLRVYESRPTTPSTWRFQIRNSTQERRDGQYVYAICASVTP
jgi:hypothetical protein